MASGNGSSIGRAPVSKTGCWGSSPSGLPELSMYEGVYE